jgi:hypothetical protein
MTGADHFGDLNGDGIIKLRISRLTLTYASETWIPTNRDRKEIHIFERKVYRRILGPVYE